MIGWTFAEVKSHSLSQIMAAIEQNRRTEARRELGHLQATNIATAAGMGADGVASAYREMQRNLMDAAGG